MFTGNKFSRNCKVFMPLLFVAVQGFAQIGSYFPVGETVRFEVNALPGTLYCWKVKENNDLKNGAESDKVAFLTTKCNPAVQIKWQVAGTYFLTVTGFNQDGCSNVKVFPVVVSDNHKPVAVDDNVSTNWSKNVNVDLLSNDFDAKNDIDPSSLEILIKPEYGEVAIGQNGSICYIPIKNYNGKVRFYYRICDLCDQCDTAMVTIDLTDPLLYLPRGISPNGDGINDRFVISGLIAYPKSSLTIYSREGILIYHSDDYRNDWAGVQHNQRSGTLPVPTGTYYYVLHLGGTSRVIKGFIFIAK
jgi:gliding motility-associated-like protein